MSKLNDNYKKVMQLMTSENECMTVAALMTIAEELSIMNKILYYSTQLSAENIHTYNTWKDNKEDCEAAMESNLERFMDNVNESLC